MSAASADTLAAKKVSDNSAVLIAQYSNKLLSLQDDQKHFTIYTEEAKHQMNNFRQHNEHLKELILKQETYSRRPNLIIRGLTLNHKEPCDNVVRKFLVEVMHIPDARHWHPLHKGPRPAVIVRFAFPRQRELVWNKHPLLKSTQFFISEDFPAEIENKRMFMYPIVAKSKHIPEYRGKVTMKMDKLYFKGREYCVKNLDSLPIQINPVTISQLENNNSICIGGVSSCFNGLSNFYSRDFTFDTTVINGVAYGSNVYNSVEQGYQHMKAEHFNDQSTANKIMNEKDPSIQKQLGNKINIVKAEDVIMKNLMLAKFKEHHDLAIQLINTKEKNIIEANHNDLYWASGLPIGKDNFIQSKWKGLNKFGALMTEVRDDVKMMNYI